MNTNKVLCYLSIILALGAVMSAVHKYDKGVVKDTDLVAVSEEFHQDLLVVSEDLRLLKRQYTIDGDTKRLREIEETLWTINERYRVTPMPITVKETKYRLEMELKELLHKLGRS